jgi:23S rRNA (uracil1939-C5)-methyltransferase
MKPMSKRRRRSKPVSITPVLAQVTALSHDGRGIAFIEGKTTFIEGALPEETVLFKYLNQRSRFDEGQVLEVTSPSPDRVVPLCQHFSICGGCSLQHMSSDAQLRMKETMLVEQLQHFGELKAESLLPPLTGPIWGYRHKARLGVKFVNKKGALLVGFREKNGRYLADLKRCEVLHPAVGLLIEDLKKLITCLEGYASIPQIEVAIGDTITALIFRHLQPLSDSDQAQLSGFAQQHDLHIYLQPGGPDSIHPLWPVKPTSLSYTLPDYHLEFLFHPTDFIQVNVELNRQMVKHVLALLDPQPNERILDLFCGLGNFTLPLAQHCAHVVGVEGDQAMVERAYANAHHNGIQNVEFHAANLQTDPRDTVWAQDYFKKNTDKKFDKILLDPPRTGALEFIPYLPAFGARRIVYVSCNPATLARDAKVLGQQGYRLTQAGIMDMFPHTSHVESVAVFVR